MTTRNLALFFPDDRTLSAAIPPFIEIRSPNPFGWSAHCLDAYINGEVDFDLISSDINFSLDRTDPASQNRPSDSFGLAHFLTALARRRGVDPYRNRMPLAWEVRTVSPSEYLKDDHAIRLYGLIRAMAARRIGDETLQQCLWRERSPLPRDPAEGSDAINLTEAGWASLSFRDAMALDLTSQAQVDSDPADAIERLLPKWRSQFLLEVESGFCRVDVDAICKQYNQLVKTGVIQTTIEAKPIYEIPVADETRKRQYGINLFSVFADQLDYDGKTYSLDCGSELVKDYLMRMVEIVRTTGIPHPPSQTMALVAGRAYERLNNPGELQQCIKGREWPPEHKAMLFCFLVALMAIRHERAVSIKRFFLAFDVDAHENTWLVALKKNAKLFPMMKPRGLAASIQGALRNDKTMIAELGATWDWLREGLRLWLDTHATAPDRMLAVRNAPALIN